METDTPGYLSINEARRMQRQRLKGELIALKTRILSLENKVAVEALKLRTTGPEVLSELAEMQVNYELAMRAYRRKHLP